MDIMDFLIMTCPRWSLKHVLQEHTLPLKCGTSFVPWNVVTRQLLSLLGILALHGANLHALPVSFDSSDAKIQKPEARNST